MTTTALAARLVRHGEPLEVTEVELPDPGQDELLVELDFAGVNPVDRYHVLGRVGADLPLPRTPGMEAVGRVGGRAVLVRGFGIGSTREGLWASAAVVPDSAAVEVPDGVDPRAAAAMGVAGLTAWRCVVELGEVGEDDRVLVLGASGGVGSIACSLAHHLGARVCGQTGDEAKGGFVLAQGADEVVSGDGAAVAAAMARFGPTVVLDPLGAGFTATAVEALVPFGRIVLFGTSAGPTAELPLQQLYRKNLRLLGYGGLMEPEERLVPALQAALRALAERQLEVAVDDVVPLRDVDAAIGRLAGRKVRGKLLLDLRAR